MRWVTPLRYRWSAPSKIFFFILAIATLIAPVPYVFFKPGVPDDISGSLISIKKATTYPIHGRLFITSILVTNPDAPVFGAETLFNWALGPNVVLPRTVVYPQRVNDQKESSQSQEEMSNSQVSATSAALKYLNYPVVDHFVIKDFRSYSAAKGILQLGDQVIEINGKKIENINQIRESYANKKVGESLAITVRRKDSSGVLSVKTVNVPLVANQDSPKQSDTPEPFIGVLVGIDAEFPIEVKFNLENVGGPSAGLMFAIAIVDKLTSEDLVRGRSIAGTGTISSDGKVGAIGGIEEKMIGAARKGATIFLAPRSNCPDIRHYAKGLQVIPVTSLSEAISVLRAPDTSKFPRC